jgi:hypothetical protein
MIASEMLGALDRLPSGPQHFNLDSLIGAFSTGPT